MAYTADTKWRNRSTFVDGREEVVRFLTEKWAKEHEYRLVKELWAFTENRIAVRYAYEYHDDSGQWYRAYGNEVYIDRILYARRDYMRILFGDSTTKE